jgi:hypothetical protein
MGESVLTTRASIRDVVDVFASWVDADDQQRIMEIPDVGRAAYCRVRSWC